MPPRSSFDRLPAEVRAEFDRILADPAFTLDEFVEYAHQAGHPVSRSAAGRRAQRLDVVVDRLRRSREMAEGMFDRVGEGKENRLVQANIDLLHTALFELQTAAEDGDEAVAPTQVLQIAKTLDHLAKASKTNADMILRLRREVAAEAAKKIDAATKSAAAAGEKGLSKERIDQLRRDLAGMA